VLFTQKQVAAELQVCVKTLQRMRRSGQLRFIQWGHRSIRIREEEVERLKRRYTQSLPVGFPAMGPAGEVAEATAPQSGQTSGAVFVPGGTQVSDLGMLLLVVALASTLAYPISCCLFEAEDL
jgi:excisionase family DNA binding protein